MNNFKEPKEFSGGEAIFVLIKRLILLNPGTYPNHPLMGVGLVKNWRFREMDDVLPIKQAIQDQIETYLPEYSINNIDVVKKSNNELSIKIEVNNVIFRMETTKDDDIKLSEL